jgi:hypothetical protein
MSFKRALVTALIALPALPATAAAQTVINPPEGDNYLNPIFMSTPQQPLEVGSPVGFQADTTNYTTQGDMFNPRSDGSPGSGGPPEPVVCGQAPYGNTVWSIIYIHRYGVMNITSSGPFDSVIAVVPFGNPNTDTTPRLSSGFCVDDIAGFQQDASFLVSPKRWYAIQVGGTGTPQGGKMQVKFQLDPPPTIPGADGVLSMVGRKITKLVLKAPKGAKVSFKCAKKRCGKLPRAFTVKKTLLMKPIAAVGPTAGAVPSGPSMAAAGAQPGTAARIGGSASFKRSAAKSSAQVHAAKSYTLLKGKVLKSGTRLEARITAPGYIGTYFGWVIGPNGIKKKLSQCMNPGSTKPRNNCS